MVIFVGFIFETADLDEFLFLAKVAEINEPRHEKTGFLHMRKQRHRSALW